MHANPYHTATAGLLGVCPPRCSSVSSLARFHCIIISQVFLRGSLVHLTTGRLTDSQFSFWFSVIHILLNRKHTHPCWSNRHYFVVSCQMSGFWGNRWLVSLKSLGCLPHWLSSCSPHPSTPCGMSARVHISPWGTGAGHSLVTRPTRGIFRFLTQNLFSLISTSPSHCLFYSQKLLRRNWLLTGSLPLLSPS